MGGISASKPYEMVSTDIFGPIKMKHFLTTRKEQYFYIITMTDVFSRWTESKVKFDITSETVCKVIEKTWISKFGPPRKILSDQG